MSGGKFLSRGDLLLPSSVSASASASPSCAARQPKSPLITDLSDDSQSNEVVAAVAASKPDSASAQKSDQGPRTMPVMPSALLSRCAAFLPLMAQANQQLQNSIATSNDASQFNIEHLDDEERHIEMELNLGVLEEQTDSSSEIVTKADPDQESDGLTSLRLPGDANSKTAIQNLLKSGSILVVPMTGPEDESDSASNSSNVPKTDKE